MRGWPVAFCFICRNQSRIISGELSGSCRTKGRHKIWWVGYCNVKSRKVELPEEVNGMLERGNKMGIINQSIFYEIFKSKPNTLLEDFIKIKTVTDLSKQNQLVVIMSYSCLLLILWHFLQNFILSKWLLPVAPIKHDSVGADDGVAGDAVRHDPHPILVGPRNVETLDTTHRTKLVPGDKNKFINSLF